MSIATVNPYANHAQLSPVEQEVLWEYAKLGDKIKRIANLARLTAESPNDQLLSDLRALEKKMGLVLTLFRASVWAVIVESQAQAEEQAHYEQDHEEDASYDQTDETITV